MPMFLGCQRAAAIGARPWCLLSRVKWQESDTNTGKKRTAEFLEQMYQKIENDPQKKLQPTEKKGVSCAMHYNQHGKSGMGRCN